MSDIQEWDVEKYKVEHECDEHWELRKNFLETHKDQFPEEQLVCLAQVFTNVELLGCRYPQETMDLVAELSEDVAKDYRVKQKSKLQRTFVKASDAASSKAKGKPTTPTHPSTSMQAKRKNDYITDNEMSVVTQCKKSRIETNQPYGSLVLLQYPNQAPTNVIETSVSASGQRIEWKVDIKNVQECRTEIFINGKKLSGGVGKTKKLSRADAATAGVEILRKYYYLIEVKEGWKEAICDKPTDFKKTDVEQQEGSEKTPVNTDKSLGTDNIGAKLMKLMGWAGGGLGKSQQGITEPITVSQTISRQGFGMILTSSNQKQFRNKCMQTLHQYVRDGTKDDLIFADFDKEERAIMHKCANQLRLKSHSFNRNGQRTLCVSRKIELNDLVSELLAMGGSTGKYILSPPTGT